MRLQAAKKIFKKQLIAGLKRGRPHISKAQLKKSKPVKEMVLITKMKFFFVKV